METYYVASLRASGWFSRSSQFNTQLSEAKEMTHAEAIKLCRLYKSNGVICVPVLKADMEQINDQR
jgi:hypothetical protein